MSALVYNEKLKNYDFSSVRRGHPFTGERFKKFIKVFNEYDFDKYFDFVESTYASEDDLLLVHTPEYIERIKKGVGRDPWDTPLNKEMYDPARLVVGTSKLAGELTWKGKYEKSIGIGGGLHHAKPSRESGFCIFNDVAVCVKNLIENYGAKRVLILDTDVHTGQGTSEIFYEDDKVLLIDIHESPETLLYPGTGFLYQLGKGKGKGYNVNIPLKEYSSNRAYEYVLDEIFKPLAKEFNPEIIIRNGGSDPHFSDVLGGLNLTFEGFRMIGSKVRDISSEVCKGRVVDLIASGYSKNNRILSKAWLSLIAGLADIDVRFQDSPPGDKPERVKEERMDETKEIVSKLRKELRSYWDF